MARSSRPVSSSKTLPARQRDAPRHACATLIVEARARRCAGARPRAADREELWALRDVSLRRRAAARSSGSSAATAPARHAAEDPLADHRRRRRARRTCRGPRRRAARGRHGLPPRADRPREHLPQRRDPRHDAARRSQRKFDEIVAFAEVEQFLDTPVKRYSSGMYVRLAFAVAAHLEPEILIVDEVLAVGDAAFQRKCLGKMGEVAGAGPHGPASSATTWPRSPRLPTDASGSTKGACASWATRRGSSPTTCPATQSRGEPGFADLSDPKLREGVAKKTSKQVLFDWVRLVDAEGKPSDVFFEGDPLTIELGLESTIDSSRLEALCFVSLARGDPRLHAHVGPARRRPPSRPRGAQGHDPTEPAAHRPVHARPLRAHGAAAGLPGRREAVRGGRFERARRRPAPHAGQPRARQRGAGVGRAAAGDAEPSLRSDSTRRTIRSTTTSVGTRAPRSSVRPR